MSRRAAAAKNDDGKKKKQQAASLARRMAGKKGQTTQLQLEVNNEEDWEKLMAKDGLMVIDVYSDWSGPCVGMIGNLKKAKVDMGGDNLILVIAKNDEIECLSRFRNKSEPTWLFAAGGSLLNGMFGANAPRLMKMISDEIKKEQKIVKGETWRQGVRSSSFRSAPIQYNFTDLFEEERERLRIAEKLKSDAEKQEQERIAREIEEKRNRLYNHMAEQLAYETVLICFPHTIYPDTGCIMLPDLEGFFRSQMMYIASQSKTVITREMFDEIFFLGGIELSDDLFEDLDSGPCLVMLLKSQIIVAPGQEGEKKPGDIEKIICGALNMTRIEYGQELVIPSPHSLPAKFPYIKKIREEGAEEEEEEVLEETTSVPGCWTPASHISKSAAVRYLFPGRAEKVMLSEEPAIPPKVVIGFDVSKQKECFEIMEDYPNDILNVGYFTSTDPATAEPLCATPEQYAMLEHLETDRLVFVVKSLKDEPLLSLAGVGATYVSLDSKAGDNEADLFFPPGVELKYPKLEEAERALQQASEAEEVEEEEAVEEEEEQEEQDEEDLMALLGVTGV